MSTQIVMPEAGESVVSGVLSTWVKPDGAFVQRDETIAEVETDKITVEIYAPASGVLRHKAAEGDEVQIGALLAEVDESGDAPAAPAAPASGPGQARGAAAKPEILAPTPPIAPPARSADAQPAESRGKNGDVRATPLAVKLAQEHGVDLSKVRGTGPGARIREQDVLDAAGAGKDALDIGPLPATAIASPASGAAAPTAPARGVTRERMSPLRQKVASRLVEAQHTAAMLTTFNECDMTAVMELRKQYKDSFEKKHGIGLGFMSFFIKACANALRAFPMVNAFIVADQDGKPAVERHEYADIAIAVASPKGLVVPVIRDCQVLSFADVEKAVKDFGTRAKDGKLALEEMQGGTFTITNGGIFGSLMSTPILNPPQSAILGMHAIKNRAVEHPVGSGQPAIRPMMYLALSYDHRIVDGAEAVRFLVAIKDAIEDPSRLLLDL
ncbi:MAG: 2-oxoglutarate dehydrogenase complex dihydrolipoyllysine-residue succinyltransferase [Leptolyngbya sp. PLA3]|nr:MAG: 2-oxoglutarate dehydrogenase complex dihydrolipoyllysine-residue succinyltransferase [Cyanobacteria bacterium CYA]MCE7968184.1 2-oxoglutarate dehydrogenase complex dihydrolipoyllysine-residue succinyltransferase [Leptolyngbya sp. PL-A3]